ncbi:hypothetical protein Tco_0914013 [Tanacetum coccineum]
MASTMSCFPAVKLKPPAKHIQNDFEEDEDEMLADKYYDLVTSFYEYGWGESFHFAHRWNLQMKGEKHLRESIKRHSDHFLELHARLEALVKTVLHSSQVNILALTLMVTMRELETVEGKIARLVLHILSGHQHTTHTQITVGKALNSVRIILCLSSKTSNMFSIGIDKFLQRDM